MDRLDTTEQGQRSPHHSGKQGSWQYSLAANRPHGREKKSRRKHKTKAQPPHKFPFIKMQRRNVSPATHELPTTDRESKAVQDQKNRARAGWTQPAPDTIKARHPLGWLRPPRRGKFRHWSNLRAKTLIVTYHTTFQHSGDSAKIGKKTNSEERRMNEARSKPTREAGAGRSQAWDYRGETSRKHMTTTASAPVRVTQGRAGGGRGSFALHGNT